jgi:hypothetical protein
MERKPVGWMGDSRKQLREFPEAVRFEIGQALYQAELGERHPSARSMRGLNAVEIVSDYRGDTYRGVYTTRFKGFHLRASLLSEEIQSWNQNAKAGPGVNSHAARGRRIAFQSHDRERGVNEHAQKDTG